MRKKTVFFIAFLIFSNIYTQSQESKVITYQWLENQELDSTSTHRFVYANEYHSVCFNQVDYSALIPTVAKQKEYLDFQKNIYYKKADFENESYTLMDSVATDSSFTFTDQTNQILGYPCKHAYKILFSNKIEFWYAPDIQAKNTPYPSLGYLSHPILEVTINGNYGYRAVKIKESKTPIEFPKNWGTILSSNEFRDKLANKHIKKVDVFNDVQINFSHDSLNLPDKENVYHYAKGTIALKKIALPTSQSSTIYGILKEKSLGDAYDRTGSIFIIPTEKKLSFLDALRDSIHVLPHITINEKNYPGVICNENYNPPIELIRFFTPFGIGHFNSKRSLQDKSWEKEVTYEQDLTQLLSPYGGNEVWVGAYIANYDKGGHQVSFHLEYHPNERKIENETEQGMKIIPLFNTLNILEIAGQPYATMFANDSLTLTFETLEDLKNCTLRFITTGHGGWGEGDEFTPKENRIYMDNQLIFNITPWREDCSTFRKYNPASGNFWNGISSSDLSRSGWCPGSISNPYYILLENIKKGKHTITIAIDMGEPEGNYFSSWNVSGVIIGENKN